MDHEIELRLTIAKLVEIAYAENKGLTGKVLLGPEKYRLTVDQDGNAMLTARVGTVRFNGAPALEELGAIARSADPRRFRLGPTLFELGRQAYSRIDVKDVARPFMEQLMHKTRESVFLGIRNLDHVTILDIVESTNDLKITSPIGTTIPLMAGAVGKVFLADLQEEQVAAMVHKRLPRFTDRSITDPQQYIRQLRRTRQAGHAVDDEEYISGVRAVAAPIRFNNNLMAAIWVVGFTPSMGDEKLQAVARETMAAAESISTGIAAENAAGA